MRFETLKAVLLKIQVFRYVTLSWLICSYRSFEESQCLYL